jgi:hypothetical protein
MPEKQWPTGGSYISERVGMVITGTRQQKIGNLGELGNLKIG